VNNVILIFIEKDLAYDPTEIFKIYYIQEGPLYVWCSPEDTTRVKENHRENREL
jgi:hypothetical protein